MEILLILTSPIWGVPYIFYVLFMMAWDLTFHEVRLGPWPGPFNFVDDYDTMNYKINQREVAAANARAIQEPPHRAPELWLPAGWDR